MKRRNFETLEGWYILICDISELWNFGTLKYLNFGTFEFYNLGVLETKKWRNDDVLDNT